MSLFFRSPFFYSLLATPYSLPFRPRLSVPAFRPCFPLLSFYSLFPIPWSLPLLPLGVAQNVCAARRSHLAPSLGLPATSYRGYRLIVDSWQLPHPRAPPHLRAKTRQNEAEYVTFGAD
jgi:hypothetical protein